MEEHHRHAELDERVHGDERLEAQRRNERDARAGRYRPREEGGDRARARPQIAERENAGCRDDSRRIMALEEWLVSTGKLVTGSDVARCVRERISPEVKARNEALLSQNRVAPELLMNQLRGEDDSETPTAGSGLVNAPPALWIGPNGRRRTDEDGVTQRGPNPLPAAGVRPPPRAEARPAIAPRLSDATELVEFVPEGTTQKSAQDAADSTEIEAQRVVEPAWKAALGLLLLVVAALLIWLAVNR
jgi:hypothetical protein